MTPGSARDDGGSLLWLALGCALLLAAFLLACGWSGGFREAQAASGHLPAWFWESVTVLGDERVLLALLLPFCRRYPQVFWSLILATVIGGLASRGIKVWLDIPRPAAVFPAEQITVIGRRLSSKSFPSGHTVSAVTFAAVWLALQGWRKMWPLLGVAGLVGFSRIAVGAHWPSDVLAASLLGVLGAWLGLRLAGRWRWGLGARAHRRLVVIAALGVATLPFDSQGYPDSLVLRSLACLWGLGGFVGLYLLPWWRGEWRSARD